MRQQNFNMPADQMSDPMTRSRGVGMDVILQLVVATLVLAVAIWYFALPN